MKHSSCFWVIAVGLVSGTTACDSAMAKRVENQGTTPTLNKDKSPSDQWVISQETAFGKNYSICTSKDAIKFSSGYFEVISKAPDWQVTLLNQKARVFWSAPLEQFHGLANISKFNVKKLAAIKRETPVPKVAEQPVTLNEGECQFSKKDLETLGYTPKSIHMSVSTNIPIATGALRVLDRIVGVEGLEGLPLEVVIPESKQTEKIPVLKTLWCLNRQMDPQTFEIPPSFAKGTSYNDVETQNKTVTLRSLGRPHLRPSAKSK